MQKGIKENKSTNKKYLKDIKKVFMKNRVSDVTMDESNKNALAYFYGNRNVTLSHTNKYSCGGASELIHRG